MRIKEIRRRRQKSQAELAACLSVTQSSVAKWESANVYPRAELLPKIAECLECTIDELFEPKKEGS